MTLARKDRPPTVTRSHFPTHDSTGRVLENMNVYVRPHRFPALAPKIPNPSASALSLGILHAPHILAACRAARRPDATDDPRSCFVPWPRPKPRPGSGPDQVGIEWMLLSAVDLRYFSQPEILQQLGPVRIARFFQDFTKDLKAANLLLPDPDSEP